MKRFAVMFFLLFAVLGTATAESPNRKEDLRNWIGALGARIYPNWELPSGDESSGLSSCYVAVTIGTDGKILQVRVMPPCSDVPHLKKSLENAVLKSQPLPLPEDPSVFVKNLTFNFPLRTK